MSIIGVWGEIAPEKLGATYIHEHLSIDLSSQKKDEDARYDTEQEITEELILLKEKGISSLVEV